MRSVVTQVSRFLVSEDGPTAVEYAVMLALILVGVYHDRHHARHECQRHVQPRQRLHEQLIRGRAGCV